MGCVIELGDELLDCKSAVTDARRSVSSTGVIGFGVTLTGGKCSTGDDDGSVCCDGEFGELGYLTPNKLLPISRAAFHTGDGFFGLPTDAACCCGETK